MQNERLFSNLSPWPPSLSKGRGSVGKRGAKPLSKVFSPSPSQGEGDKGGEVSKHSQNDTEKFKNGLLANGLGFV